ncbi:hypothetical protein R6Q57_007620 [Mikania cordata]
MSGSSAVEIDFFSRESSLKKFSADRRDIQGVISKINPELLKSAIASASANTGFLANTSFSPMPATFAPMTIFFNGNISVFDVTSDHAESVIKLAESLNSGSKSDESTLFVRPESSQNLAISRALRNDLPLSRKRSLRRFLEKRNERHASTSPYAYSQGSTSSR